MANRVPQRRCHLPWSPELGQDPNVGSVTIGNPALWGGHRRTAEPGGAGVCDEGLWCLCCSIQDMFLFPPVSPSCLCCLMIHDHPISECHRMSHGGDCPGRTPGAWNVTPQGQ